MDCEVASFDNNLPSFLTGLYIRTGTSISLVHRFITIFSGVRRFIEHRLLRLSCLIIFSSQTFLFIRPTATNLASYERWSGSEIQTHTWLGDIVDEIIKVDLREGNTMIIPTGWIHAVVRYTLTPLLSSLLTSA